MIANTGSIVLRLLVVYHRCGLCVHDDRGPLFHNAKTNEGGHAGVSAMLRGSSAIERVLA